MGLRCIAAVAGAAAALAVAWALRERHLAESRLARVPEPAPALPGEALGPAGIRIRGAAGLEVPLTRAALERLLATRVGSRAREILASGALRTPLTIEISHRGDHLTAYRVPGVEIGETIVFDPWTLPLVETELGRRPATPETVLAHEFGHALFKLRSEADVIREIENPVREELGLPRRSRF
jgi:hypothetical protein